MFALQPLALLALGLSGSGNSAAAELVGTWRAQVPQEVSDLSKKMGIDAPQAQFVFRRDNTFQFNSRSAGANKNSSGTYKIADHAIHLATTDSGWPGGIEADLNQDHTLSFEGLKYVKLAAISMEGTWKLIGDGSTKIVFENDGRFHFVGSAATSRGKFKVDGNQVMLVWTEIDSEKVDEGAIHKSFTVDEDGNLKIDTYRYQKQ
jgi:hypothetical protein